MSSTSIALAGALAAFALASASCRGQPPSTPGGGDAGTTTTTSGEINEPGSLDMDRSTPDPPARADPPQILPPEVSPPR